MSSINVLSSLPNDHFLCSICANIFNDPVTTPCGHSFCKTCLNQHWDQSEFCQCPTCHKRFLARPEICTNAVIQEISVQLKRRKVDMLEMAVGLLQVQCGVCIETTFRAVKSCLVCQTSFCSVHLEPHLRAPGLMRHQLIEPVDNIKERVCPIHEKVLDFYCRKEEVCVCLVCLETDHSDHDVVTLGEESAQQKEKIESKMAQVKMLIDDRMERIKKMTDSSGIRTEKANKEIEKMEAVLSAFVSHTQETQAKVRTGLEEKLQNCQERDEVIIKELQEEISNLKLKHSELEELLQSDDPLHLLRTFQAMRSPSAEGSTKTMVYSDVCVETVRLAVSQLLDTFEAQLKTLTRREITRMKQYKESVTFDPATAGRRLAVYESGKRIKHHKYPREAVADDPGRFTLPMVFGTTGFTSGRHYWEVQVGLHSDWLIGVAKETVSRKDVTVRVKSDNGFYAIGKDRLTYEAHCTRSTVLQLAPRPTHIGVYLDYEDGRVSFYDVNENKHIHSFTGETFTEKLYPYFYLYSKAKKSGPMAIHTIYDQKAFALSFTFNTEKEKEKEEKQNTVNSRSDVTEATVSSQPEPMLE